MRARSATMGRLTDQLWWILPDRWLLSLEGFPEFQMEDETAIDRWTKSYRLLATRLAGLSDNIRSEPVPTLFVTRLLTDSPLIETIPAERSTMPPIWAVLPVFLSACHPPASLMFRMSVPRWTCAIESMG